MIAQRRRTWRRLRRIAQRFNRRHPVGTRVRYYPARCRAGGIETATRSKAWVLASGLAVVKIEGRAGGVAIESLEVLP